MTTTAAALTTATAPATATATTAATAAAPRPAAGCAAPGASASAATYAFLRVMPVLMFSVVFWIVYDQMAANFYSQACQSNLYFDQVGGAQMNGSMLNVADCLAVVVCIPLFDRLVYPWVERAKGSAYTPLQKE